MALKVADKTSENLSSMLVDVRRGTDTEISYLNGYIVKRGEEVGIRPVMNYMLMHLVIGKQQMISREVDAYVPWDAWAEAARQGGQGADVGEAEEEAKLDAGES